MVDILISIFLQAIHTRQYILPNASVRMFKQVMIDWYHYYHWCSRLNKHQQTGAPSLLEPIHTRDVLGSIGSSMRHIQALRFLVGLSNTTWTSLDNQTRLFIVWASLIADREGLSPSSSEMRRNLDWLCGVDNTNTIEMAMLLSHVRWMITQSYWKHRSCDNKDSIQITNHPLAKPNVIIINTGG